MEDGRNPPSERTECLTAGALAALLEISPAPMWLYEATTLRVLAVNDRALAYFGCDSADFPALPAARVETPDHAATSAEGLWQHCTGAGIPLIMRLQVKRVALEGRAACLVIATDMTAEITANQALRDSEARYRRHFEVTAEWFWQTGPDGRVTYISPNVETVLGIPVSSYVGKLLSDTEGVVIDPASTAESLAAMTAQQPYRDFVYSRKLPNGKTIWVNSNGVPFYDENGEFLGYRGVARDVTAQIEAERTLRESEKRYRELFEAASDYYWETDGQARLASISGDYERVVGIAPVNAIGKRLSEIPGVSIELEMAKMAQFAMMNKAAVRGFVYSRTLDSGEKRWFKTSGVPFFDENGKLIGARGVGVEITKQVLAEQAAQLAQSRLHDAVAHVAQPFVFYDANGRAVAQNQSFTDLNRIPGIAVPMFQGDSFRELAEWQVTLGFYATGPGEAEITVERLLEAYESGREETRHLHDGRWMLVVYRALPGGGKVGLWSDVTALKRAEAERRSLEEQLHHAQRLESLGTLAGGVAHEINNALVPVIALTKLVASKLAEDSRERRNLTTVVTSAERSRDLVKQILDFSRKAEARCDTIDLVSVTEAALGLLKASLPATIRLETALETVPPISGDPNRLHQVIVNLVNNAAQAIGDAMGVVGVSLRRDAGGGQLCLSVTDTGCGMDEATKARIFEPFFTTKEVGQGTGLGLAVVHGIIKEHGGRIEIESRPGQGARFDIFLPLAQRAAGAAA